MSYGLIESGQGKEITRGIMIIDSGTIRKADEKETELSFIERIKNKILRRK